jgi:hypothetical protein
VLLLSQWRQAYYTHLSNSAKGYCEYHAKTKASWSEMRGKRCGKQISAGFAASTGKLIEGTPGLGEVK